MNFYYIYKKQQHIIKAKQLAKKINKPWDHHKRQITTHKPEHAFDPALTLVVQSLLII